MSCPSETVGCLSAVGLEAVATGRCAGATICCLDRDSLPPQAVQMPFATETRPQVGQRSANAVFVLPAVIMPPPSIAIAPARTPAEAAQNHHESRGHDQQCENGNRKWLQVNRGDTSKFVISGHKQKDEHQWPPEEARTGAAPAPERQSDDEQVSEHACLRMRSDPS